MIRRCGNCAYAEILPWGGPFLTLKCTSPHSQYRGRKRNAGYFGCCSHVACVRSARKEPPSPTSGS